MNITITNAITHKSKSYTGDPAAIAHDIAVDHPYIQARMTDLHDVIDALEENQNLIVECEDKPLSKSEGSGGTTAEDQLGHDFLAEKLFVAARWLSGNKDPISTKAIRDAQLQHPNDAEAVALLAHQMEPSEENKEALRAVVNMETMAKAEEKRPNPPHSVLPGTDTAYGAAKAVSRAFADHTVKYIHLGGKHSEGSMLAEDPRGKSFILKSGSGGKSPAEGVDEEVASQARREGAFYHVANSWGMGSFIPSAEFVIMDFGKGIHDWAVIELLDPSYKNMEKVRKKDAQVVYRALEAYRLRGILHRWSVLDFVLGSVDRHAGNLMISLKDSSTGPGNCKLIDHGSSFAGPSFNPGKDEDSFVPFYLRYHADENFYQMDDSQKLESMPKLPPNHDRVLAEWIRDLEPATLEFVLRKFGIDVDASMARLRKIQMLNPNEGSVSLALNKMWLGI